MPTQCTCKRRSHNYINVFKISKLTHFKKCVLKCHKGNFPLTEKLTWCSSDCFKTPLIPP